jgi:transcriptional regulator with XRE-family HTH domain
MLYIERKQHAETQFQYAEMMETMGDRIRRLRLARGLTQGELAKLCDVTTSAVSQWEIGSTANIKLRAFLLLTNALRTDFAYLVYGPERKPQLETSERKTRTHQ